MNDYLDSINIKDNSEPYINLIQLLLVLPPSSNNLLPEKYRYLMTDINSPLIEYYPEDFNLIKYQKNKIWDCLPILPLYNDLQVLIKDYNFR